MLLSLCRYHLFLRRTPDTVQLLEVRPVSLYIILRDYFVVAKFTFGRLASNLGTPLCTHIEHYFFVHLILLATMFLAFWGLVFKVGFRGSKI